MLELSKKFYRLNSTHVFKVNESVFYEYWLDYFNSLLIHNYFFPATKYEFIGFDNSNGVFNAVVKQEFIIASENTELESVKEFLEYNGFKNIRNNDYLNDEIGLIVEDLHDENVLSNNGVLFFIDTIFYLTPSFLDK